MARRRSGQAEEEPTAARRPNCKLSLAILSVTVVNRDHGGAAAGEDGAARLRRGAGRAAAGRGAERDLLGHYGAEMPPKMVSASGLTHRERMERWYLLFNGCSSVRS